MESLYSPLSGHAGEQFGDSQAVCATKLCDEVTVLFLRGVALETF